MKIGIVGSGMIGSTTAHLFAAAGHEVAIANSRGPDSLQEMVSEIGGSALATTVEDAAAFGEIVLVAVPLKAVADLPAGAFAGKVVVDANNYYPGRDGVFEALDADRTTSSELLADHLGDARVVKAFNTMYYLTLGSEGRPDAPHDERLALFVAADDAEAKQTVSELIEELGFAAVDTGSLAEGGRRQQPGTSIYAKDLTAPEAERAVA